VSVEVIIGMEVETIDIGESAPDFELPGVDGQTHTLSEYDGEALVVVFTCNHCPTAKAYQDRIKAVQSDYDDADVVAISSNNPIDAYSGGHESPSEDSFEHMKARAEIESFNFPYLRDESQEVALAYGAQCTPHAFVFNGDRKLVYEGAIDDDKSGDDVTETYVRDAIEAILAGEEYPLDTVSPLGCSTKWKQSVREQHA
jgi:peroxiredoxin